MEIPSNCEIFDITCYWTWMGLDGIARTKVKPQAEVTIKESIENSVAVNSLYKAKKFPLLIDARQIKSISKEARDNFSIKNRSTNINSFAVIIESPLSRIIGNFFMGLNKPSVPAKLFNNEQDAVNWLKQYL